MSKITIKYAVVLDDGSVLLRSHKDVQTGSVASEVYILRVSLFEGGVQETETDAVLFPAVYIPPSRIRRLVIDSVEIDDV